MVTEPIHIAQIESLITFENPVMDGFQELKPNEYRKNAEASSLAYEKGTRAPFNEPCGCLLETFKRQWRMPLVICTCKDKLAASSLPGEQAGS